MSASKELSLSALHKVSAELHRKKKRIVFTNGAFDILHAGHVQYLEKARSLGDVLILGVNTDASVRAYKGPHRPVNSQADRIRLLTALTCVDYAVLFSEPTPLKLINAIRPDVLVKGADWKAGDIVGAREVLSWGGKIRRITFLKGRSTTNVIEKILAHPETGLKINTQVSDWKQKSFNDFRLYAVSDLRPGFSSREFLRKVEAAYDGGADIVQLRGHGVADDVLFSAGIGIKTIAEKRKKLFFVNDRLDLALATGAHGLHVGQNDLPVHELRSLIKRSGQKLFLGKSTHSLQQALLASREGLDYIGVGPVFSTPTKPNYKAVGLNLVRQAAKKIKCPFVAIGGIDLDNLDEVLNAGANRIAAVRAIFEARDPKAAARRFTERIRSYAG